MRYGVPMLLLSLALAGATMSGVSAQSEGSDTKKQSPSESDAGLEKGNLSERGVKELLNEADLHDFLKASDAAPVFIFKHSTTCPISGGAYREVERYLDTMDKDATPQMYYVKVIESKPVSKEIEHIVGVKHESPQLILVSKRKPLWSKTHKAITKLSIITALTAIE